MQILLQWDHDLFVLVNHTIQNTFFDAVLPFIRNRYTWVPVYIGIIFYVFNSYSLYKASYYILFIISAVVCTDIASGQLLKKYVQRKRPCQEANMESEIITRIRCSRSYSFPSSHATNHFGLAVILFALFGKGRKRLAFLLYGWAAIISFAQIYVGVHYPLDIIGGAILGVIIVRIYLMMIAPTINRLEAETVG